MQTPGTQVVSRKKLAGSGAPPYIAEAEALLEKREFAAALAVLEQGTKDAPKPIEALLALAEAHWELVHPKESIDFLKEAIQKAPKDARPFAQLGRYLLYKGLRDQALNFLDRAIALDPDDPETKKLRERAALNKKKAYTVVANAADFTAALGEKKPQGATRMHKKEATRFLSVDPAKAAEELAKAERGAAEEMDRALAALLGADLLGVDPKLLKPEAATSSAGGTVRTVVAFVVVAFSGLLVGALAFQLGPKGGASPDDVPTLVAADTLSSLRRAADLTSSAEDTKENGASALAYALLLVEHGGDLGMLERAEQLLAADPAAKKSPHGLAARALIKRHPRAETDADIDDDLAKPSAPDAPWTLIAIATRAEDQKDDAKALAALHKAAVAPDAPPRALHLLARAYGKKGDFATAETYLARLDAAAPGHAQGLATAVVVDVLEAAKSREKGEKVGETAAEKRITALLKEEKIPPLDAAELAVVVAAVASARGDESTAGEMIQRATEQAKEWPGIVQRLAELHMLNLDTTKAVDLVNAALDKRALDVDLLVAQTRARVLAGLSEQRVRQLRLSAKRGVDRDALLFPVGKLLLTPGAAGTPLTPAFDPRFFPESSIKTALDLENITPNAAQRRLDVVARLELAELALAQGDTRKARDQVDAARDLVKNDPEVHIVDAMVKKRTGDAEGSRAAIEQALAAAPDDPRVLIAAARLHLEADDTKSARASLEQLAKEGFQSPSALALAALVELREGRLADARRIVDEARKTGPGDLQVLRAALRVARAEQDMGAARAAAQAMFQSSPTGARQMGEADLVVGAYLAELAARRGEEETAREEVAKAVKAYEKDADVRVLLGDVLKESGKKDEAVAAYEEAASLAGAGAIADEANRKAAKLGGKVVEDEDEPAPEPKKPRPKPKRRR